MPGLRTQEGSTLRSIQIEGFKSFQARRNVEFFPLTVLAGANGSGKSSLIQGLLLLKQSAEPFGATGGINLMGPHVSFTSPEQFLWTAPGVGSRSRRDVSLGFELSDESSCVSHYSWRKKSFSVVSTDYKFLGRRVSIRDDMTPEEAVAVGPQLPSFQNDHQPGDEYRPSQVMCFLTMRQQRRVKSADGFVPRERLDYQLPLQYTQYLGQILHVPGLRVPPARRYLSSAEQQGIFGSVGTFQQTFAQVLTRWQETKDPRLATLQRQLQQLELTWSVASKRPDFTTIEVRVGRTRTALHAGAGDRVNIADVGLGVPQVLPVLVALLHARPSQLVYVEQPETHLHPRAQARLVGPLAEAVKRGVQVVIETHSSLLLTELQRCVATGELPANSLGLHWFSRDERGATSVATSRVDEAGSFGDWPEDFADTFLETERNFAQAAFKKLQSRDG